MRTAIAVLAVAAFNTYLMPALLGLTTLHANVDVFAKMSAGLGFGRAFFPIYLLSPILAFVFSMLLAMPFMLALRVYSLRVAVLCAVGAVIGRHLQYNQFTGAVFWIGEDVGVVLGICAAALLSRRLTDWFTRPSATKQA